MAKQAKGRDDKARAAAEVRWAKVEEHEMRIAQASECLLDEDYLTAAIGAERGAAAGRVTGEFLEAQKNEIHFLYAHYGSTPEKDEEGNDVWAGRGKNSNSN